MGIRGGCFDPVEVEAYIQSLVPEATGWDDLRFPASGFNPAGSTAPATVDTATGLLFFAGNADNIMGGVAQMPHAWASGTAIYPHLHLRFPTSAAKNTRWKLEYDVAAIGANFTNNSGTYTNGGTITVTNPQNVKKHVLASFSSIDMANMVSSTVVLWRISRLASTDVLDDDTNDCLLIEFDIHYQVEKFGTPTQTPA